MFVQKRQGLVTLVEEGFVMYQEAQYESKSHCGPMLSVKSLSVFKKLSPQWPVLVENSGPY